MFSDFSYPLQRNPFDFKCWPQTLSSSSYSTSAPSRSVQLPQLQLPLLWNAWNPDSHANYFPPSPSDTSSSVSSDLLSFSPSSSPDHFNSAVNVIQCDVPLVAPKPLPYHSPKFLQFDLLPDFEEDLSHPPYTQRSSKRKRDASADELPSKRRVTALPGSSVPCPRSRQPSTRHCPPVSSQTRHYPHPHPRRSI